MELFTDPSKKRELRPHQADAIQKVRQSLGQGLKRVVLQAPVGFGKTITAAKMIEGALAKGREVLFTVPRISLIDQTVREFRREGIDDIGVIQASHPLTNDRAAVQIASVQTLAKRPPKDRFGLIMVDEAHLRSEVIDGLLEDWTTRHFIALTATPWTKGMGLHWDGLVVAARIGWLIENGYLSKFSAYAPDVPDLSRVKIQAGDFQEGSLAEAMSDGKLVGNIVETWLSKGQNRPTLCFGVNCAHAKNIQASFLRAGVSAGYCDAFTDIAERGKLERDFRAGEVKVVCSVRTLTTGVDWPVSCIIDAAPTMSEMLHVQKIGRGLRVNEGTEDLVILDHAGNSLRLGFVTDIHHEELDKTKPGEKQKSRPKAEKLPKECANCGCLNVTLICPFCGHERKPVAGVDTIDGDLKEITKPKVWTRDEKQAWYSGLKHIQRARGRSNGWLAHAYRDKIGVWPRGLDEVEYPATQEMWNFVKAKDIAFAKRRESVSR